MLVLDGAPVPWTILPGSVGSGSGACQDASTPGSHGYAPPTRMLGPVPCASLALSVGGGSGGCHAALTVPNQFGTTGDCDSMMPCGNFAVSVGSGSGGTHADSTAACHLAPL